MTTVTMPAAPFPTTLVIRDGDAYGLHAVARFTAPGHLAADKPAWHHWQAETFQAVETELARRGVEVFGEVVTKVWEHWEGTQVELLYPLRRVPTELEPLTWEGDQA